MLDADRRSSSSDVDHHAHRGRAQAGDGSGEGHRRPPRLQRGGGAPHVLSDLHDGSGTHTRSSSSTTDPPTTRRSSPSAARPPRPPPLEPRQGVAIRTGIAEASGEYVVIMDADATYPVSAIESLVELLTDHDLVRGNRESSGENMPLVNRIGNWFFSKLFAIAHGLERRRPPERALRAPPRRLPEARPRGAGFDIETEIGIKAQARHFGDRVPDLLHAAGRREEAPSVERRAADSRPGDRAAPHLQALGQLHPPWAAAARGFVRGRSRAQLGNVETPYFGLSINSFIVAALGVLAGFQLIFGVAAALYGVEAGKPPSRALLKLTSQPVRFAVAGFGGLLIIGSLAKLIQLTAQWAATRSSPTPAHWSSPPPSASSGSRSSRRCSSSRYSADGHPVRRDGSR